MVHPGIDGLSSNANHESQASHAEPNPTLRAGAAPTPGAGGLLVVVILRGGADGLSLAAPVFDDQYQASRPTLAQRPGSGQRLARGFELHPRLAGWARVGEQGQLAVVPATGTTDHSRSHFQAQDVLEQGDASAGGGWLGRALAGAGAHPHQALALGERVPLLLSGAGGCCAVAGLDSVVDQDLLDRLLPLYAQDRLLGEPAAEAAGMARRLAGHPPASFRPRHGAEYAREPFAQALARLAQLRREVVPDLLAATIDLGGWDSHIAQGVLMASSLGILADGLTAFATDAGEELQRTCVVVVSEFGRRLQENASGGTDHGHGGVLFALGQVPGGVHGSWPGLSQAALDDGDVPVANDLGAALRPLLELAGLDARAAFPDAGGTPLPI